MSVEMDLRLVNREHVISAIDAVEREPIKPGEKFSVVYKGQRFDPKQLLAQAFLFSTGGLADVTTWEGLTYHLFQEKLEVLGFRVVKNPKQIGDDNIPVLVYEVKAPQIVQANYQKLFSSNRTRFYWNNDKFAKLKSGDCVFIVNAAAKQVHFCYVKNLKITASYDHEKDISSFSHEGEAFEVAGQWETFVCLELRDSKTVSETWRWKTLGSEEHTYFCGPDVSTGSAKNNIVRANQLIEVFTAESEAEHQLQVCYQVLSRLLPKEEKPDEREPAVWFVMQGSTYSEDRGQKYLWAPLIDRGGRSQHHWDRLTEVKPGDIIVHNTIGGIKALSKATSVYSLCEDPFGETSEWRGEGRKIDVQLLCSINPVIKPGDLRRLKTPLAQSLQGLKSPFNKEGTGNQGYLYDFNWEALAILLNTTNTALPTDVSRWLPEVSLPEVQEENSQNDFFEEAEVPLPTKITQIAASDWLAHVQKYMSAKGFDYSLSDIANFYLAMRTKPLVILAGISGTGKTQIVRQFAKAIGYGDERHCVLIPVRPDWADNTDLVGYRNIQGEFEQQKLLKVLQDALAHPDEPFFVILDEMNLARVEHYFSDFLSVLETRERKGELINTEAVVDDSTVNRGVPVTIPQNLMIIGTVNMDETTHPFSRKVLDRANAIEMNHIHLPWATERAEEANDIEGIYADSFVAPYLNSIELSTKQKSDLTPVINLLVRINELLEPAGLHFGYRVRDELAFYIAQHAQLEFGKANIMTADDALDYQLMQKVLPRIQGSSMAVLTAILMLLKELSGADIKKDMEFSAVASALKALEGEPKYPRSIKKLMFMLQRFNDDGFTSFWL